MKTLLASLAAIGVAFLSGSAWAADESNPYAAAPDAASPYAPPPPSGFPNAAPGNTPFTAPAPGAAPYPAQAALYGTVISSRPITAQFAVPRERCVDQPGYVQPPTSGGGAVVGGVLGGLAGNAIGAGAGRAVATGLGAIAGVLVGNNVEAANTPPVPVTTTNCAYSRSLESRIVGYDVVYEVNGTRYSTRMANDPGPRIALRPVGDAAYDAPPPGDIARNDASSPYGPTPVAAAPYPVPGYPYPAAYPYPSAYPYPPAGPYYGYPSVPVYVGVGFGWHGRWR